MTVNRFVFLPAVELLRRRVGLREKIISPVYGNASTHAHARAHAHTKREIFCRHEPIYVSEQGYHRAAFLRFTDPTPLRMLI